MVITLFLILKTGTQNWTPYLFNIVIVMIDIKKKIQAARDYASKSYRVIRKVSKNGFIVQRDKNADKHFLDGIDWAEKEIFKDLILLLCSEMIHLSNLFEK